MHALTRWFIHNPVAANLTMALIIIGGVITLLSMRIEGFPKLPADTIQVETLLAGAHAEQVDRQITQKIEKALEGLPGVKKVQSTSTEGYSSILIQKNGAYLLQRLLNDVRLRLDGVATLPQAADKPIITRNNFDFPALIVQLHGHTDANTLQHLGRQAREALLANPEISKLKSWGEFQPEIQVNINPERLEKYGLSGSNIIEKIQQSSLALKSGSLKTVGGEIALHTDNQAYRARDFADIPVVFSGDGSLLRLGDLTDIRDTFEDNDVIVRFDGQPALGMEVLIGRKENLLDIAAVVKNTVAELQTILPPEVELSIWADSSHYISERLQLLKSNAIQGLLLVFALLALFLNLKLAFWVAMGIPVAVTGALGVMGSSWVDYSLNDITTFGLIIALGILVDDAVVVGESVFAERQHRTDPVTGTEHGVRQVATATIFGILTTVAAFFPMMLIDNALGKVLASFSGVVILTLLFSLFESHFILPAHLARISLNKQPGRWWVSRLWSTIQASAQGTIGAFNHRIYQPALVWSLHQRYTVLVFFIAFATLGLGLIGTGKIKTVFFPDIPGQLITVHMEMDARAPYRLTLANTDRIEHIANTINQELTSKHALHENPIRHILVVVGSAFSVDLYAELAPADKRKGLETLDILRQWQDRTGRLEGATQLTFSGSEDAAGGFAIDLYSKNADSLRVVSQELMANLGNIKGVSNLREGMKNGIPELQLKLKQEAYFLGFNNESLATQIGLNFGGTEAQRLQRDGQETRVIVRNQATSRSTIADLMHARLQNDKGLWFSLPSIARIESDYSPNYIARRDGKRVNTIRANIDRNKVAPSEVAGELFTGSIPELNRRFPEVSISKAGELEEMGAMNKGLKKALLFTCVLIFALLAIPLQSYWQPLIIMSVIPFGFIGASIGHMIMGLPLSLLSFFGMLALTGVVVNDSLVMLTRYNQARQAGSSTHDALLDAGVGRFRAIVLTTATTVAGLTPLMLESSEQAQYLIPAAVSLAWGEIFATAITLLLVPVLIAISVDLQTLNAGSRLNEQLVPNHKPH